MISDLLESNQRPVDIQTKTTTVNCSTSELKSVENKHDILVFILFFLEHLFGAHLWAPP